MSAVSQRFQKLERVGKVAALFSFARLSCLRRVAVLSCPRAVWECCARRRPMTPRVLLFFALALARIQTMLASRAQLPPQGPPAC